MTDRVRFALIGCGRISGNHVEAITAEPRAELAGVCDRVEDLARRTGDAAGVPWFTDFHEMIEATDPDCVTILTPSGMHPVEATQVMSAHGRHVVVEKPMALALSDVERIGVTAERCGVRVFPVYQNRYNTAVRFVRDAMQTRLGRPVLGAIRVRWCREQSYYDQAPWRGTWAMDGGALTNQGIHALDVLLHLMGDVESVVAATANRLVTIEAEDTAVATLRFASGALGVIEVTTAARPVDLEASVSVLAEGGTAVLGGLAFNTLEVFTPDEDACARHSQDFPNVYGLGHRPYYADVVADLLDAVPHPISFDEGARAVRLLNAIYASAEQERWVRLADRPASANLGRPDEALRSIYTTPSA